MVLESIESTISEEQTNQKPSFNENFTKSQLVQMNPKMLKDLTWNSSLDESVDSGLSSTPLTSSSFSFFSNNISISSQKLRDFRISQNSLDHYSNHPSTRTRWGAFYYFFQFLFLSCINKENIFFSERPQCRFIRIGRTE
jgi:hypothetical protein